MQLAKHDALLVTQPVTHDMQHVMWGDYCLKMAAPCLAPTVWKLQVTCDNRHLTNDT
jgi:hypothetical protein